MLFTGDIDEWWGEGNQKHNGFTTKTFHHIYQLRTQRKEMDFFKYLKTLHRQIKVNMEFKIKEKEKRKSHRSNTGIVR